MEAFYKVKEFNTIRELIDMSADEFAWRPAFEIKKSKEHYNISYRDYREDLNAFCSSILDYGLDGGAVGVCSDNRYEYCATYVGTILAGGVIVPTDKELHEDDIIGIFGNEEVIGKTNLSDVCEGKRTILTCHFLKTASEPQLQEFRQVYGKKDANADDLLKVRTLLENAGSRRYAEDIMLRHLEKARASVHAMPVDEHYRMLLTGMVEYLGNRLY